MNALKFVKAAEDACPVASTITMAVDEDYLIVQWKFQTEGGKLARYSSIFTGAHVDDAGYMQFRMHGAGSSMKRLIEGKEVCG